MIPVFILSIYSGHLSKSVYRSISPWLLAIFFSTICKNTVIYLIDTLLMVMYIASHFLCYYNHAAGNIPAKTISALNKEEQIVRREKVASSLGSRIRMSFVAPVKFELDLMVKGRRRDKDGGVV